MDKRSRKIQSSLHAARESRHAIFRAFTQFDEREQFIDARRNVAHAVKTRKESEIFARREVVIERDFLRREAKMHAHGR